MKRFFLNLLCICILSISLAGCENSAIDTVKSGILNFDKSTTIGKAFDNYSYFKKTSWTEFETKQGQRVVEFEGVINYDKVFSNVNPEAYLYKKYINNKELMDKAKPSILVQFVINKDSSFQISFFGIKTQDARYDRNIKDLAKLYRDERMDALAGSVNHVVGMNWLEF